MAEMTTGADSGRHRKTRGVKKMKKLPTRVDLTPMVDLGFLLITFFIFTTTMSQPKAMGIILPADVPENKRMTTANSGALTLIPAEENRLYYYEGMDPTAMKRTTMEHARDVIIDKKTHTTADLLMVVIKPAAESTLRNTIALLDEMRINAIGRYALTEIEPVEKKQIHTLLAATK